MTSMRKTESDNIYFTFWTVRIAVSYNFGCTEMLSHESCDLGSTTRHHGTNQWERHHTARVMSIAFAVLISMISLSKYFPGIIPQNQYFTHMVTSTLRKFLIGSCVENVYSKISYDTFTTESGRIWLVWVRVKHGQSHDMPHGSPIVRFKSGHTRDSNPYELHAVAAVLMIDGLRMAQCLWNPLRIIQDCTS